MVERSTYLSYPNSRQKGRARYDPAVVKRETIPAPPPGPAPEEPSEPAASDVELRLSIGRDGVGVELGRPAPLLCATVTELCSSLPGARFPLDVSGGVSRFRHRRGLLERLTVELRCIDARDWIAPRLRGLIGPRTPEVRLLVRPWGAAVGIADAADPEEPPQKPPRVLAFDLTAHASGADVIVCLRRVRGRGLPEPATTLAMAAVSSIFGALAKRRGSRFVLGALPAALAKALLPEAGARAPSADRVTIATITCATDTWILHAFAGAQNAPPHPEAVRASEAALLLEAVDDALYARDNDRARRLALDVLARAPGHPEACARIAEIDAHAGGRAEAALATLSSAVGDTAHLAHQRGALLAEIGDRIAARATLARAAESDDVPEMSAAAYVLAASLADDPNEALDWLDRAVGRDPGAAHVRWARAHRRLRFGRIEDAMADIEHLEALARGIAAKHALWRNAAKMFSSSGMGQRARMLFERALRYEPDEPEALLGLGRALTEEPGLEAHLARRGIALVSRALEMPLDEETKAEALVVLARALAAHAQDRPAAIARVRDVPANARVALEARGLEGKWRAEIGDIAGASLAYARLRDLAEARAQASSAAIAMLREAAEFERGQGNLPAAHAHLAAALRLAPRDPVVQAEYRAVAGLLAHPAEDVLDVEELEKRYRANPTDENTARALARALEGTRRAHDLVALLLSRVQDAPEDQRARLQDEAREIFTRLEKSQPEHAALYRDALLALS